MTKFDQLVEEDKRLTDKGKKHLMGLVGDMNQFLDVARDFEVESYTAPFAAVFGSILEMGYLLALQEHEIELNESLIREKEKAI